jgi:two-component system, cell cycle sensor histidine kinase and response regulator CckA
MTTTKRKGAFKSPREKFLGLSLESSRKSYYPQLLEQLQTEKENAHRLQLLIDNLPARIAFIDKQRRYVLVNRECERTYGMRREELVGAYVADVVGEDNYSRISPYIAEALAGKQVHFEVLFETSKGELRWIDNNYVPMLNSLGEVDGFYVLAQDDTEKRRAEEEKKKLEASLNNAQKFKAIGTLAGGIAHDFNNLLMGIQGRSSLMSIHLDPSHPLMEHVNAIEEYVHSATDLTRQLLGLARGGKYEVKPIDLNKLVRESVSMFGRTKKEISIHKEFSRETLVVEADERQLEQVLLNLYVNAWQAMPNGGSLYITTKIIKLDDYTSQVYSVASGKYASISVTDTGIGMSQETKQHAFDPFFTTKEKQRGTGMGLASAYGIIKNHLGAITIYSELGHGTTFNIYLPLSQKDAENETRAGSQMVKGTETILLVDDEKMILDVGKAMLETLGYRVLTVDSGERAIETILKQDHDIDMVILDMIMPGMNGGTTFDRIREIQPEVLVILSSGYSINGQADQIMKSTSSNKKSDPKFQ